MLIYENGFVEQVRNELEAFRHLKENPNRRVSVREQLGYDYLGARTEEGIIIAYNLLKGPFYEQEQTIRTTGNRIITYENNGGTKLYKKDSARNAFSVNNEPFAFITPEEMQRLPAINTTVNEFLFNNNTAHHTTRFATVVRRLHNLL